MMDYNWKNIFKQSPEKVKITVLAVGGVVCALLGVEATVLETVGVGIAVERVLDLFYVAPQAQANKDARALEAIDLGKQLATAGEPFPDPGTLPISGSPGTVTPGAHGRGGSNPAFPGS